MPSIFVWKSDVPNMGASIRYLMGGDWYMEDHNTSSHSMRYRNQTRIHSSILVWDAERMSASWVGSECLDLLSVPYHLIKKDSYATLEQVGQWFRCTLTKDVEWTQATLEKEYETIRRWHHTTPDELCQIRFSHANICPANLSSHIRT